LKKENNKDVYHRELNTILKFGTLINSSLNIEDVLNTAMKWAEEFIDAEASSIYELDKEKNELYIRLARGEKKEPIKRVRFRVDEGIAGWVVQTGKPRVVQDVRKEKRFSDKYDKLTGFKTRSMVCVPLILRDKPIGALQVLNKKSKKLFSKTDLSLLTGMAQQIAIAMENAKLYRRLERKFELTAQELNTTQERLIRSERLAALGHLVQGVAHEIRNPITTIGGFAQRIKRALKEERKLQKYIDIILHETARLENLVRQVREFAAVQSASLSMDDMGKVIDQVIEKFEPLAIKQAVRLVTEINGDMPLMKMDSSQLVTALSNVMENALESMPEGGTLALEVNRENNHILITVRDTGYGMAPDQLDTIYDPFVTSKIRGAGLGLTMVHRIVMNHNGEIKISSQLNKGTMVTVQLPVPANQ
jgi:signal transduction histidine kinase